MESLLNATGEVVTLSSKDVVRRIYRIEPSAPITLTSTALSMKVFDEVSRNIPTNTAAIPNGYKDPDNLLKSDSPLIVTREVALYLRYKHPEFAKKKLYVPNEPFKVNTGEIVWYSKLLLF
jgi:hypothetical protein